MLQEAKDLQQNAVAELYRKITQDSSKTEFTFRAPTGSGKTRMMADLMNRVLQNACSVVFLVSTLSKGGLAEQNYQEFSKCVNSGTFVKLKPHLISSEANGEERLHIPADCNVYVLPRDLYKKDSKLKEQGVMLNFLMELTMNQSKTLYLIKDECHQQTKNIDELNKLNGFFSKVINCSATPNLKRGQHPDVEITDADAENAKLIKQVEMGGENEDVEVAINKFEEIKESYRILLGVNPCLIIQVSNKNKTNAELDKIKNILMKHQSLKWMYIVGDGSKEKGETNDDVHELPQSKWADRAKESLSLIDVIIFKMKISEGWDIPRACMLYQVRETASDQLDEQVVGRVRRNPRLLDFEKLSDEAQKLATTAWVWGVRSSSVPKTFQVNLFGSPEDIPSAIKIKTTRLKSMGERKDFDIESFLDGKMREPAHSSIFDTYAKLEKCDAEIKSLCYAYAKNDTARWWHFCDHLSEIEKEYNRFVCDYSESMDLTKDENGSVKEVSFPVKSSFADNGNYENISDWAWRRKDGHDKFAFDSEAEREWVSILKDVSAKYSAEQRTGEMNPKRGQMRIDGSAEPERLSDEKKNVWGKNYLQNSEIKFEYYLNGIHSSYPDFIMRDKKGSNHLFEVKSVNVSSKAQFDSEEYKSKINALKACYKQCSILTGDYYYLPVLKDDVWQITVFYHGEEESLTKEMFRKSFERV